MNCLFLENEKGDGMRLFSVEFMLLLLIVICPNCLIYADTQKVENNSYDIQVCSSEQNAFSKEAVLQKEDSDDDEAFREDPTDGMSDDFLQPEPPVSWPMLQLIRVGSFILYCYFKVEKGFLFVYDKTVRKVHGGR
jgi:hypothetical protein